MFLVKADFFLNYYCSPYLVQLFQHNKPNISLWGILWDAITGILEDDAGGGSVPHHIQCGSGRSGSILGRCDGRAIGRAGRTLTGRTTPNHHILQG